MLTNVATTVFDVELTALKGVEQTWVDGPDSSFCAKRLWMPAEGGLHWVFAIFVIQTNQRPLASLGAT